MKGRLCKPQDSIFSPLVFNVFIDGIALDLSVPNILYALKSILFSVVSSKTVLVNKVLLEN